MISRRELIGSAAALTTAGLATGQINAAAPTGIVISSHNGLRACARAMEMLKSGADTLDAVIAGVNINEEDPQDHSVGYGGLPNEEGVVELDSCVMHGPTRRCGFGCVHPQCEDSVESGEGGDDRNRSCHDCRRRRHALRPRHGLPAGGPAHRRRPPCVARLEEISARPRRPHQLVQRSGNGQAVRVVARSVSRCR